LLELENRSKGAISAQQSPQERGIMKRNNPASTPDEAAKKNPIVEKNKDMAPRTPMEVFIAGLYASILDVPSLGIYDNLESLGLTLEAVARLKRWLQEIFHVDIPAEQLFLCPTIDSLVNLISELWGGREIVEEIAWTFLQIKQLSDDEVRSQLMIEYSTEQEAVEKPDRDQDG
jgi:hypothetical protein